MKPLTMALAVCLLGACGGRTIDTGPEGSGGSDDSPARSAAGTAGTEQGSEPGRPLPTHPLGTCTPGFYRSAAPTRPCNWLTDAGICFDDKEAACACICPSARDSVCWSGFYGGEGLATLVHCD